MGRRKLTKWACFPGASVPVETGLWLDIVEPRRGSQACDMLCQWVWNLIVEPFLFPFIGSAKEGDSEWRGTIVLLLLWILEHFAVLQNLVPAIPPCSVPWVLPSHFTCLTCLRISSSLPANLICLSDQETCIGYENYLGGGETRDARHRLHVPTWSMASNPRALTLAPFSFLAWYSMFKLVFWGGIEGRFGSHPGCSGLLTLYSGFIPGHPQGII